jgi:hypothetical protein
MPDRETLTEVLKIACDRWARAHWLGCMPARVESFDPATNQIDAKPIIRDPHVDIEGAATLENLPVITGVPVVQFGAGGMRITFPVEVGDTVLLVVCRRSLDKWKARGGEDVDPGDTRIYHYSDAVAIPGILPFSAPWTGVDTDAMTLGKDGGIQIHITEDNILLGGAAAVDDAADAQKVSAQLTALKAAILVGATSFVDGGTAFHAALSGWPGSVAASNLKVKP